MNLALLVLDGPLKGQLIYPHDGYVFTGSDFSDSSMMAQHAIVCFDLKFNWNIRCLGSSTIRVGLSAQPTIALVNNLIFNIGTTGFKVVPKPGPSGPWESELIDYLKLSSWNNTKKDFHFFHKPLRLIYTHGPQTNEIFTLSYGPRILGYNQLDLKVDEPNQPRQIAKFFQISETIYIENLSDDKVLFNNKTFLTNEITDGSILTFGTNVIKAIYI